MTKAERVYRTLNNKADEVAHLGADSIRFSGDWEVNQRTLNAMIIRHETNTDRASRMNLSADKMNVLRIITNSIENEQKRLRSL